MKLVKFSLLCVLFLPTTSAASRAKGWRGIVPLHSDRSDVERILGIKSSGDSYDDIMIGTDRVEISYTTEGCDQDEPRRWRVPIGTVVEIRVFPKVPPTLSSLKIDIESYSRFDTHVSGIVRYESVAEGLRTEVHESSGTVAVLWFIPASDDLALRCNAEVTELPTVACTRLLASHDPSGMFCPKVRGDAWDMRLLCISLETAPSGNRVVLRGRIISLVGTSFVIKEMAYDRNNLAFVTEELHGIQYTFNGKFLWNERGKTLDAFAPLIGTLSRSKFGTKQSRLDVPFTYRPECPSPR